MRALGIHKNIIISDTKLTLCLSLGFISSHLTVNKLFPVNLRVITTPLKSMSALIMKPMLILLAHTDDLGWYIMFFPPVAWGLEYSQRLPLGVS